VSPRRLKTYLNASNLVVIDENKTMINRFCNVLGKKLRARKLNTKIINCQCMLSNSISSGFNQAPVDSSLYLRPLGLSVGSQQSQMFSNKPKTKPITGVTNVLTKMYRQSSRNMLSNGV
jgi:hypothetical protein